MRKLLLKFVAKLSSVLFGRGFGTGSELLERVTARVRHVCLHVKVDPCTRRIL
jgi:glycyl-tRNA synthetase beta subunit